MFDIREVAGLEAEMKKVNDHIERLCKSDSPSMQKMMDWVLEARGKQIRPVLTLLCSKLKGKKVDATETAAVIEICHTASLIHDDIIDDADMRRGRFSVHKKFGPEMAVYAGDFMIFSTIGRTGLMNKPWYRTMFAKLEIMCNGEVGQFDNRYNVDIAEERYIDNIIGKTSAMFSIACGAGACEGKCNEAEQKAVETFAEKFGLLFQLRDDLMDFVSTSEISRKTIHNDFWSGYYTLPAIHTFADPDCGAELKEIALKIRDGMYGKEMDSRIAELIQQTGGCQYTLSLIDRYAEEARSALSPFRDLVPKRKLIELVDELQTSAHSYV